MGEPQVLDVGGQLRRQLAVRQPRPPGRQMQLVDREGRLVDRAVGAVLHPLLVLPAVVRLRHDRSGGGRHLGTPRHRVGAQGVAAVRAHQVELVERALADARYEQLPHTGRSERTHRIRGAVPVVEVSADPHPARVGRPDGEAGAGDTLDGQRLRAERLPQLLVASFADQMQIEFTEGGQEAVRILELDLGVVVRDEERVLRDGAQRQQPGEEALAVVVQFGAEPLPDHGHGPGVRPQRPDGDAAGDRVGAEQRVRVVVAAAEQPFAVTGAERLRGPYTPCRLGRQDGRGPGARGGPCALGRLGGRGGLGFGGRRSAGRGTGGHWGGLLGSFGTRWETGDSGSDSRSIAAIGTGSQSGRFLAS